MKCAICGKEIEETFLEKIDGTAIGIKKGEKKILHHVCSGCQKEYKENVKKKILEMN